MRQGENKGEGVSPVKCRTRSGELSSRHECAKASWFCATSVLERVVFTAQPVFERVVFTAQPVFERVASTPQPPVEGPGSGRPKQMKQILHFSSHVHKNLKMHKDPQSSNHFSDYENSFLIILFQMIQQRES
ncbi:hypothetical protein K0M31_012663 [Melipona bicolor]|uniref:Uncharacterized protein n=1 Tax=Melipona bicolor TaxID=60889 RepID=A0AA40KHA4_9HYME|nr:hypothetical protein K0M31_012663 [Melipona bicolor]